MTESQASGLRQPKSLALYALLASGTIVFFPIVGPLLIATNRFSLASHFSFLPGISVDGGRNSGISAAIYIVGGLILVGGIAAAAGWGIPGPSADKPEPGVDPVATPTATPTPKPEPVVSGQRKLEFRRFANQMNHVSAADVSAWSPVNKTTIRVHVNKSWGSDHAYDDENQPMPEAALIALNQTANPPDRVIVNLRSNDGHLYTRVVVKEAWADPFVGFQMTPNELVDKFDQHTTYGEQKPDDVNIPRYHLSNDEIRRAYAWGVKKMLNSPEWTPTEFNSSQRPNVVDSGLYYRNVTFDTLNVTYASERVIFVTIKQPEDEYGGSIDWVGSAWAQLLRNDFYDVDIRTPGMVLRLQYESPKTGNVYLTVDYPAYWANQYNEGEISWHDYMSKIILYG